MKQRRVEDWFGCLALLVAFAGWIGGVCYFEPYIAKHMNAPVRTNGDWAARWFVAGMWPIVVPVIAIDDWAKQPIR